MVCKAEQTFMRCGNHKEMPKSIRKILARLAPQWQVLTIDEQAWVTAASLRLLAMKIDAAKEQSQ